MKTILLSISAVLLFSFGSQNQSMNKLNNYGNVNSPNLKCPAPPSFTETIKNDTKENYVESVTENIDQDWYSKAMKNIQKEEYNISYNKELDAYQSPNRKNNIRFIYHNDGFTAVTRETSREKRDDWEIQLRITNYEFGIKNEGLKVAGNKAFVENDKIRIDYSNDEDGMRQDFIIKKRPEGVGKLRLNISADTKLKMIVGADALMFKDDQGIDKMKYSALKCWDANGQPLRAYFEKNNKLRVTSYELRKEQLQITNDKLQIEDQEKQIPNPKSQIQNQTNSKSEIPNSKLFSIVVNDEDATYPITIDPLSTSPSWTAEANQNNSEMGNRVTTMGDVNGDGYSDVMIAAHFHDNGQTDEGLVFCYYGSATGLPVSYSWYAESDQASSNFGYSVSTAGDVNADGYSDILIGAIFYDNGQNNEGKVFAWYGSASGLGPNGNPGNADWSNELDNVGAQYGIDVAAAGDVNRDGYSDIIVGANLYTGSFSSEGTALLFYGSATGISNTSSWSAVGGQSTAFFGLSVSTAGDVNGDGYSDVIVGANKYTNGQTDEGKIFVYHGSSSGLSASPNWTAESDQATARFGVSVATAGDVNGDGYSDIIAGTRLFDNGESDEGKAFVWYGGASGLGSNGLPSNADWSAEGNQAIAYFGYSVSAAGDVNGDGYSDIIIGAYNYNSGSGKVFVYNGSSAGPSQTADWTAENGQVHSEFGYSVFTAGDVNGDGFSDVLVGSKFYDSGQPGEGAAYLYTGSAAGLSSSSDWTAESDQSSASFGWCVSSAGDVNGDGYSDVLIGARYFDNGEVDEGRAFLYKGSGAGLSANASWTAEGGQTNSQLGFSVSTLGDVNGDGFSDVIIGAPLHDNGETDEGLVFVYYGSASGLPAGYSWYAEGNQASSNFGWSVSTAGDVNGDGYSDVIVGAVNFDNGETDEGAAFVYHGSANGLIFPAVPNWIAESNQTGALLGISVSTAGDVNGDGYSDVIVGSRNFDNPQPDEGSAGIYYGSSSGLPPGPDRLLESNQSFSAFGFSVSSAGDVNGDGYSDILVGAPLFDNGSFDEGKVFAYYGSATGISATSNWSAESNQTQAIYGNSVACAGDVNGDGYSDVVIGAYGFDNGQTDEGKAFCYYGSPTGLSVTANWTAESDQVGGNFGNSVASAGDVNGDGYSDVIVGAPLYDNGEADEGKTFFYYGNGGKGLVSLIQQFRPGSFNNVISSGGLSGADGQVRLRIFGKSPYGRAIGTFVWEHKENGIPFSGSVITNSTAFSNSSSDVDLGNPSLLGVALFVDIFGLNSSKVYKWRTRIKYNFRSNPYQKYGPWKYYNNYNPVPVGNFKSQSVPSASKTLNVNALIQARYNAVTNSMLSDTVTVNIRNYTSPYNIIDSKTLILSSTGQFSYGTVNTPVINNTLYYIQISHRNSLETWNKGSVFTSSNQIFDFTTVNTQAFGNNMTQVNTSPVKFAVYSGDVNQNGTIDLNDILSVFNAAGSFSSGYVLNDLNGDSIVDLNDLLITYNNSAAFVAVIKP